MKHCTRLFPALIPLVIALTAIAYTSPAAAPPTATMAPPTATAVPSIVTPAPPMAMAVPPTAIRSVPSANASGLPQAQGAATNASSDAEAAPNMGQVGGRVFRSDNDKPIRGATVTLEQSANGASAKQVARAVSDDEGRYSLMNVSPGQYRLVIMWDLSCRSQEAIDQIVDMSMEGGWVLVVASNGVAIVSTQVTVEAGADTHMDFDARFTQYYDSAYSRYCQ